MTTQNTRNEKDILIGIVKHHTSKVIARLPFFRIDEYDDILQLMWIRAIQAKSAFKVRESDEASASLFTYITTQLGYYVTDIVQRYLTDKRKIIFSQIGQEDEELGDLLESTNSYTASIQLQVDVRNVMNQLKGNKRILAQAILNQNVVELNWSSKKVSKIRAQLAKEFKKYGLER